MNKKILAFVYNIKTRKFLTLRNNPKTKLHGGDFWYVVTGSVENKETLEDATKREVKEETNLDVEYIYPLNWGCIYGDKKRKFEEHYFLAFVQDNKIKLDKREAIAYKWLNINSFVNKILWYGNKVELKSILTKSISKKINHKWVRLDDYTDQQTRTLFINDDKVSYLTWHDESDFSKIKPINQVYGVCFTRKGRILIINTTSNWSLPGGTPEKGEDIPYTLKREVDEEGDIEINNIIPIGYNRVQVYKKNKKIDTFYQLRYVARITKIKPQTIDPAKGHIPKRKFIDISDFLKYCPWGKPAENMINKALQVYCEARKK